MLGAKITAGLWVFSMIWAIVNVFPVPVAPKSTWFLSDEFIPATNSLIAFGWSPEGLKSDWILNIWPDCNLSLTTIFLLNY